MAKVDLQGDELDQVLTQHDDRLDALEAKVAQLEAAIAALPAGTPPTAEQILAALEGHRIEGEVTFVPATP